MDFYPGLISHTDHFQNHRPSINGDHHQRNGNHRCALVTTIVGQAVLAASTAWAAVNFLGFSIDDINSTEGFWAILESLLG